MDVSGDSLYISASHRTFPRSTPPSPPRFQTPSISTCMHPRASLFSIAEATLLALSAPAPLLPRFLAFPIPSLYLLTVQSITCRSKFTLSLIDDISRPYHQQHRLSRRCKSSAAAICTNPTLCLCPYLRQAPHGVLYSAFPIPRPG